MNLASGTTKDHAVPSLSATELADLAARLDATLVLLLKVIAAGWRILGPRTVPVWNRISRARQRLARLLARLAANIAAGRPAHRTRPAKTRPGGPRAACLPQGRLWLIVKLGHPANATRSHIEHELRNPAIAAALAAAPGVARTLRPLCRLLGVDLPDVLRLPPRPKPAAPPRPPRPAKPRPEPYPPGRGIPRNVMAAARAWKRHDASRALKHRDASRASQHRDKSRAHSSKCT